MVRKGRLCVYILVNDNGVFVTDDVFHANKPGTFNEARTLELYC